MDKSKQKDLLRFDPTNASDDQIRAWLFAIIDAELEKNDTSPIRAAVFKDATGW